MPEKTLETFRPQPGLSSPPGSPPPQSPGDGAPTDAEIASLDQEGRGDYQDFLDAGTRTDAEKRAEFNKLKALSGDEKGSTADKVKAALEKIFGGDSVEYDAAWLALRDQIANHSDAYWQGVIASPDKLRAVALGQNQVLGARLNEWAKSFSLTDNDYIKEKKRLLTKLLADPATRDDVAASLDEAALNQLAITTVDTKQKDERKKAFDAAYKSAMIDDLDLQLAALGPGQPYVTAALQTRKLQRELAQEGAFAEYEAWYQNQEQSPGLTYSGPGRFLSLASTAEMLFPTPTAGAYGGLTGTVQTLDDKARQDTAVVVQIGEERADRVQMLEESLNRYIKNFGQEGESVAGLDQEARDMAQRVANAVGIVKDRLIARYKRYVDVIDPQAFLDMNLPGELAMEFAGNRSLTPAIVMGSASTTMDGVLGAIVAGSNTRTVAAGVAKVAATQKDYATNFQATSKGIMAAYQAKNDFSVDRAFQLFTDNPTASLDKILQMARAEGATALGEEGDKRFDAFRSTPLNISIEGQPDKPTAPADVLERLRPGATASLGKLFAPTGLTTGAGNTPAAGIKPVTMADITNAIFSPEQIAAQSKEGDVFKFNDILRQHFKASLGLPPSFLASDAPSTPEYAYFQNQMISDPAKLADLTRKTTQTYAEASEMDRLERIRGQQEADAAFVKIHGLQRMGLGPNATPQEIAAKQAELDAAAQLKKQQANPTRPIQTRRITRV